MYGELLAEKAFALLLEREQVDEVNRLPFVTTVENACLLHDLGNPPFGHLGEYAIQQWFASNDIKGAWRKSGVTQAAADLHYHGFTSFDGNAQGFRIVTRLQWLQHEYGLNLTLGLLGAMIKYLTPGPTTDALPYRKKIGFFAVDRELVRRIWEELGLRFEADAPAQRHPLAYLMEAADDIAYCVSDIEDALEKRIVSELDWEESLPKSADAFLPKEVPPKASRHATFLNFRINFTRYLVETAAKTFIANHDAICAGSFTKTLLELDTVAHEVLEALKQFSRKRIFTSAEAVNVELSGAHIVGALLDAYKPLLKLSTEAFERLLPDANNPLPNRELPVEKRLISLLPRRHLLAYQHAVENGLAPEPICRSHLVVDYIVGMTDSHAVQMFDVVTGRVS